MVNIGCTGQPIRFQFKVVGTGVKVPRDFKNVKTEVKKEEGILSK